MKDSIGQDKGVVVKRAAVATFALLCFVAAQAAYLAADDCMFPFVYKGIHFNHERSSSVYRRDGLLVRAYLPWTTENRLVITGSMLGSLLGSNERSKEPYSFEGKVDSLLKAQGFEQVEDMGQKVPIRLEISEISGRFLDRDYVTAGLLSVYDVLRLARCPVIWDDDRDETGKIDRQSVAYDWECRDKARIFAAKEPSRKVAFAGIGSAGLQKEISSSYDEDLSDMIGKFAKWLDGSGEWAKNTSWGE
jgi:hypothetical protein